MSGENGFTLVELILVVAILGMLAVAVAPQVGHIMGRSQTLTAEGTAGQVRSGIQTFYAKFLVQNGTSFWPPMLDASALGNCGDEGCFGGVLNDPLFSEDWSKDGDNDYRHLPTNQVYHYSPASGVFKH